MTANPLDALNLEFVYRPDGGEERVWEFNPYRLMSPELEVIETRTGLAFDLWIEALRHNSVVAFKGLLFVLLKRSDPTLTWATTPGFSISQVVLRGADEPDEDPADVEPVEDDPEAPKA